MSKARETFEKLAVSATALKNVMSKSLDRAAHLMEKMDGLAVGTKEFARTQAARRVELDRVARISKAFKQKGGFKQHFKELTTPEFMARLKAGKHPLS